MEEILWKEEYNVGCDYVDSAHKKLFSVIRRVENIIHDNNYEKDKYACIEAIKFLSNYTLTHFAQEEAFMREVGYAGLPMHKKIHDELRENTLPSLITELEDTDYSRDVVIKFVSIFVGWLTGHILIEDRAITGKAISKWNQPTSSDLPSMLDQQVKKVFSDLSDMDCQMISHKNQCYDMPDALYYQIDYPNATMIFIGQYTFIRKLTKIMFGEEPPAIDKHVILAYVQLVQTMGKEILMIANPDWQPDIQAHKMIEMDILNQRLLKEIPTCNLRWKTNDATFGLVLIENK